MQNLVKVQKPTTNADTNFQNCPRKVLLHEGKANSGAILVNQTNITYIKLGLSLY